MALALAGGERGAAAARPEVGGIVGISETEERCLGIVIMQQGEDLLLAVSPLVAPEQQIVALGTGLGAIEITLATTTVDAVVISPDGEWGAPWSSAAACAATTGPPCKRAPGRRSRVLNLRRQARLRPTVPGLKSTICSDTF